MRIQTNCRCVWVKKGSHISPIGGIGSLIRSGLIPSAPCVTSAWPLDDPLIVPGVVTRSRKYNRRETDTIEEFRLTRIFIFSCSIYYGEEAKSRSEERCCYALGRAGHTRQSCGPLSRRGKGGAGVPSRNVANFCRVYQFNCGNTTVISLKELEGESLENPNELQAFQSVWKPQEFETGIWKQETHSKVLHAYNTSVSRQDSSL